MKVKSVKFLKTIPFGGRLSDTWTNDGTFLIHLDPHDKTVKITGHDHNSLLVPISQVGYILVDDTPQKAPEAPKETTPLPKANLTVKVAAKTISESLKSKK
jgi:hypothetical protein